MKTESNAETDSLRQFWMFSAIRALSFYTVGSFFELILMTVRNGSGLQIVSPIAADLLGKFGILFAASVLFGLSFFVFRLKGLPSAAKRFFHILIVYLSVLLVMISLVNGSSLDMQDRVLGYFAFSVLYLIIYGICMLVRFIVRRKRMPK